MSPKVRARRALRLSRPDSQRWLTVMVVLSHRTFRWSVTRKRILWLLAISAALWFLGVVGSGYGWWATKKIMSFAHLQNETQSEEAKVKAALEQAKALEDRMQQLRQQQQELLKALDPQSEPALPTAPGAKPAPPAKKPEHAADASKLSELEKELEHTNSQAETIQASLGPILGAWSHTPSVLPTAGYFSSGFGRRIDPIGNDSGETSFMEYHTGIDISNALDTPIQATADGTVEQAGWMEGYGNAVLIRHSGNLETLYGHMNRVQVQPGQQVSRGDIIGLMGHSGRATGVHCHYEVRVDGKPVNPLPYLKLQKQWIKALT